MTEILDDRAVSESEARTCSECGRVINIAEACAAMKSQYQLRRRIVCIIAVIAMLIVAYIGGVLQGELNGQEKCVEIFVEGFK